MKEFLLLIITRQWREAPGRTALTVLGVALAVGLVVAVQMANRAALDSFRDSVTRVSGRSSLSVVSDGPAFDENILASLAWSRSYGEMLPLVEGRLDASDGRGESLVLLGVDLLKDTGSRDLEFSGPKGDTPTRAQSLQALARPDSLYLSETYARLHQLKAGSIAVFAANGRAVSFYIAGLFSSRGAGGAWGGRMAVMDIAAAQTALGLVGRLSRIDWVLRERSIPDEMSQRLKKELPPHLRVETPEDRGKGVERLLKAFRVNLTALSLVSLLVGALLSYHTMTLSVLRRAGIFGALRTIGLSRRGLLGWTMAEAAALAFCGTVLGLVGGRLAAFVLLKAVGATVSNLYLSAPFSAVAGAHGISGLEAFGCFLVVTAAALPAALRASRLAPAFAVRSTGGEPASREFFKGPALAGAGLWFAALVCAFLPAFRGIAWGGYASAFFLMLGAAALTPFFLWAVQKVSSPLFDRFFPVEAVLAGRNLLAGLRRSSAAVGALVVSVGLVVSVAVMVGSFRSTVQSWLDQTLQADLYVRAGSSQERGFGDSSLDPALRELFSALPQVAAVDSYRSFRVSDQGRMIQVGAVDAFVTARYGKMIFLSGRNSSAILSSLRGRLSAVVSEPLARAFGLKPGDFYNLRTATGVVPLEIRGVFMDYSDEQGTVLMDRGTFKTLYGDDSVNALAIYLKNGTSAESAREDLRAAAGPAARWVMSDNAELKRTVLRIFDQTFAITYALEIIALVVAVLGILACLGALILERAPEIALIRYLGATRARVRNTVLWEGALMGVLGCALGCGVGAALSVILVKVIHLQSFGWTIQIHPPWMACSFDVALVLSATVLAAYLPARSAAKMPVLRAMNRE